LGLRHQNSGHDPQITSVPIWFDTKWRNLQFWVMARATYYCFWKKKLSFCECQSSWSRSLRKQLKVQNFVRFEIAFAVHHTRDNDSRQSNTRQLHFWL